MILKILGINAGAGGSTSGSVGRVIKYITRPYGKHYLPHAILHNLSKLRTLEIIKEFEQHFQEYGKTRRGGNELLHVILSLPPNVRQHVTEDIMREITEEFIDRAFPLAKVFAVIHDAENMHAHLAVSANELMSDKSTRLSKAELYAVHKHMLKFVSRYPGLEPQYSMDTWGQRLTSGDKEYYARLRSAEPLDKDTLKDMVHHVLAESQTPEEFYQKLNEAGHSTYERNGAPFGVRYLTEDGEERKMRFSRLAGVQEGMKDLEEHARLVDEQMQELEDLRDCEDGRELDAGEQAR